MLAHPSFPRETAVRKLLEWRGLGAVVCLVGALAASPAAAQEADGLTFDVSVLTGDSGRSKHQAGRGWIAGKRTRLDFSGGVPGTATDGLDGDSVSMIVGDSAGASQVALVMHESKKVAYPGRMMEQLKEMMETMEEKPKMTFSVSNVVVDTLGAGETISGFATRRFRLTADIAMAIEMMGESATESMHIETEGDYAEKLSEFSDPLRDTRGVTSMVRAMPWVDSSSIAEMEKLTRAGPRGLALRQVDRVTGVTEGGDPVQTITTRLSNIKRERIPLSVFAIPADYTEMETPLPEGD